MARLPGGVGIFEVQDLNDLRSIRYIFMNDLILHEMRRTREQVFGKYIHEVAPEAYEHEGGLAVIETYRQVARDHKSVNLGLVEYSNEEVAGTYECSVHHIQDNYVYVMLRNVTELEQSRRELAQANQLLEQRVKERTAEVEQSKKELEEINKTLENRIKERTALLEQKNKELEQFAFVASHDLQEPLRTMKSFVELLQRKYQGKLDEKADQYLSFISDSSSRMNELVKGLLEHSRIGHDYERNWVDCNQILENVKTDLSATIKETKSKLEVEELPEIKGSSIELRLLFQNLINNAIKFRKPNTEAHIKISAEKAKNKGWVFAVKDNGIGIADENQEKIFQIFQRLHSKKEYEGTGIGLAHCQKIVKLFKGDIWVESQPNQGSTFYFNIPL